MSDPFLDALNLRTGVGQRLTAAQLAERSAALPGARITSQGRSPQHNRAVHGVADSQHIEAPGHPATAIDLVDPKASLADVQAVYPGEKVIYHDAGSGYHYHIQGAPGTEVAQEAPQSAPDNKPDPFLDALNVRNGAGAQPAAPSLGQASGQAPADNSGVRDPVRGGDPAAGVQNGSAGAGPGSGGFLGRWTPSANDIWAGGVSGANALSETALRLGSRLLDAQVQGDQKENNWLQRHMDPYLTHASIKLQDWASNLERGSSDYADERGANQNSWSYKGGDIAGATLATLPATEIKLLKAAPEASSLIKGLARYGNLAVQGGAIGGALSRGNDVGENIAFGAAAAPVAGAIGEHVLVPAGIKAWEAIGGPKIAKALAERLSATKVASEAAPEAAAAAPVADLPPLAEGQKIRTGAQMADAPPEAPHVEPAAPTAKDAAEDAFSQANADKLGTPEYVAAYKEKFGEPPPLEVSVTQGGTKIPPQALGSRGARTGIEAHDQMSPEVAQAYHPLVAKGVSPDEALREADIIANGGKPSAATVSRNPAQMQAEKEGAKSSTAEGQALSAQAAANNQALHETAQKMVADHGGAPEPGAAMQTAAENLKKANDAAYQKVSDAYAAARLVDGDHSVPADALNAVLKSPEAKAQVAGGGPEGQLVTTTKKLIDLYTNNGKQGLTPEQFNSIVRTANGKYDPMGGGVNHWVTEINKAADAGLDQFDSAGPAYKAARAKMRAYASQYRDPKGVASLIKSDAQGNLVGDNTWRSAENMIGAKNDKPFLQIVKQLKANNDKGSLAKLKASIIQDAYEAATGRQAGAAADQAGNSPFSGSKFHARLNQIGQAKLNALFSPEEIARLASLGRAGVAINEAVPGTVNTSNTASAVLNALKKADKIGKPSSAGRVVDKVLHAALPIGGAILHGAEGTGVGVGIDAARSAMGAVREAAASKANAKALAKALSDLASPDATRASDQAARQRLAESLRRKGVARAAAAKTAPAAAVVNEGRR